MAEIRGKYVVYSFLPITYSLTGNNRQARFTFDDTQDEITLKAQNAPSEPVYGVQLISQNDITIKRARIVPRGGAGLLASPGTLAGQLFLNAYTYDTDSNRITLDSIHLDFLEWGEWENVNAVLKPYKNTGVAEPFPGSCDLFISGAASKFTADDFNIQADYVGQGVQALLEMEIETAGLSDSDTHDIF
jgi:hypothetical protein